MWYCYNFVIIFVKIFAVLSTYNKLIIIIAYHCQIIEIENSKKNSLFEAL